MEKYDDSRAYTGPGFVYYCVSCRLSLFPFLRASLKLRPDGAIQKSCSPINIIFVQRQLCVGGLSLQTQWVHTGGVRFNGFSV